MDAWTLTPEDLEAYAQAHGNTAAANLLVLTNPDRFTGDYEKTLARLTTKLTTKPCSKMRQNDTF